MMMLKLSLLQTVRAHRIVRRRGSHIFQTIGPQMTVKLSALRAGRPLPPKKIPGNYFCQKLSRPQGHIAARWIRSIDKYTSSGLELFL
jgi:hypothetical protein